MKKLTKAVLAILVVASSITACKKGDDDPSISLRSRKARLAGEWTVTSSEMTEKTESTYVPQFGTTGVSGYTSSSDDKTTMSNGGAYNMTSFTTSTQTGSTNNTSTTIGNTKTLTYTIEKDGTWTSETEYTITSVQSSSTTPAVVVNQTTKVSAKGTWQFLGKNKELEEKKSESVSFSTAESTTVTTDIVTGVDPSTSTMTKKYTYGMNENVMVWHISMLKNKEMAVDYDMNTVYSPSFTYSETGGSSSGSYDPNTGFGSSVALSKRSTVGTGKISMTQE